MESVSLCRGVASRYHLSMLLSVVSKTRTIVLCTAILWAQQQYILFGQKFSLECCWLPLLL